MSLRPPTSPPATGSAAWERKQVNLRLSRARKAALRKVASDLPAKATPADAIDRAIESCLAARAALEVDAAERLANMEDAIERHAMERRFEADRHEAAVAAIAHKVETLQVALTSALAFAQSEGDLPESADSMPMRERLARQTRSVGAGEALAVRALWQAKTRGSAGRVSLDFTVALLSPGAPGRPPSPGRQSLVRLHLVDAHGAFAKADAVGPILLSCRRAGHGWDLAAHAINADGAVGSAIGSHRI